MKVSHNKPAHFLPKDSESIIFSGWTANRAVWNKGARGIVAATREVEGALPFALLGFDCDNGTEFLNYQLLYYFQKRTRAVGFIRCRPYHKDDQGHVEQKNWSRVSTRASTALGD